MDLSKLSDADLKAAYAGDWNAVSDEGLRSLSGNSEPQSAGSGRAGTAITQAFKGATFGFGDEILGGVDALVAGLRGQNMGDAYNQSVDRIRAIDKKNEEEHPYISTAASIAGSIPTGGGWFSGARSAGGALLRGGLAGGLYGAGEGEDIASRMTGAAQGALVGGVAGGVLHGALDRLLPKNKITPEQLKEQYRTAKNGLKDIGFSKSNLRNLATRVNDEVGGSVFNVTDKSVPAAVKDVNDFARRGVNAYQLDEFRSQLGGAPQMNRLRDILDDFSSSNDIPTAYRDSWRRARLAENLQGAIDRGGDSTSQMRTRIRNLTANSRGLSDDERKALEKAGRAGLGENLTRVGRLPAAILSAATGTGLSPAAGAGVLLGGKALDAAADRMARNRAEDALATVLGNNTRQSIAERFGMLVGKSK